MQLCVTKLKDHEAAAPQSRSGGQDTVPSAAGQAGGGGGWRQTEMGQQSPVHADLCGILRGTRKCLALSLSVSESWRRQEMHSGFTGVILDLKTFNTLLYPIQTS